MTEEALERLEAAAWSYDGHVTHGSFEAVRKVVEAVVGGAVAQAIFEEHTKTCLDCVEISAYGGTGYCPRGAELQKAVTGG